MQIERHQNQLKNLRAVDQIAELYVPPRAELSNLKKY